MFSNANSLKWTDSVTAPRAVRISPQTWEQHRTRIVEWHQAGRTKQEIREAMIRDFSFEPTLNQYTTQFDKWDLKRYNKSNVLDSQQPSGSVSIPDATLHAGRTLTNNHDIPQDHITTSAHSIRDPFVDGASSVDTSRQQGPSGCEDVDDDCNMQDPFTDQHHITETEYINTEHGIDLPSKEQADCDVSMTGDAALAASQTLGESRPASVRTISNTSVAHDAPVFIESRGSFDRVTGTLLHHGNSGRVTQEGLDGGGSASSMADTPSPPPRLDPNWDAASTHDPYMDADTFDRYSGWESYASNSQISIVTSRGSHTTILTDTSRAMPCNKYLLHLYPYSKLKKLRHFATKHVFHDWSAVRTINSILAEADFFRVSLVFHDAFDLYLFAYMLLTDGKIERNVTVDKRFRLQALAGCAESARNLSQVRLCRESLDALSEQDKDCILAATGFPLHYWYGHLAALEKQTDRAASYIQKAVSEIGRLEFRDSAAVTSMLVRELVARYRLLSLQGNTESIWLKDAHRRLNNGEFSVTIAGALRKLLTWCASTLMQDKLDVTIKECFSDRPEACVTSANGHQIPQQTIMLVVHFYCLWIEDDTVPEDEMPWKFNTSTADGDVIDAASATDRLANTIDMQRVRDGPSLGDEAVGLINNEMEISLLGIFTTLSRMITEQTSSRSASTAEVEDTDISVRMKEKATILLQLSGEDLETAFIRSYFFINARKSELGYGLHPQRYLRALAIQNMPKRLIASGIGPDWLNETASAPTPSIRSFSMQSSASSTRRLLYDPDISSALPQPSPRSSISLRVRQRLTNVKRKYQPSISSRQSRGMPSKHLKQDLTGDTTSSAEARKVETERELLRYLGQSMTSLRLE